MITRKYRHNSLNAPYGVEIFCVCGAKAKTEFLSKQGAETYELFFEKSHKGLGHGIVSESEYRDIQRQRKQVGIAK